MTDAEIETLLRSNAQLVVIEAPAGCGKTYQAASYAADVATVLEKGKVLVLTHTHAACSVVAERTKGIRVKVQIQTLDSLINQVATAYRLPLRLPEDVAGWARSNGYDELAEKVSRFLFANPMVCLHLTKMYPVIICDEHQDSSLYQNKIVRLIGEKGSFLRIFGDPMQIIPGGRGQNQVAAESLVRWEEICAAGLFGNLETPHRWADTNPDLGAWIQRARGSLQRDGFVDLTNGLPEAVRVQSAENGSMTHRNYLLRPARSRELSAILSEDFTSLFLSANRVNVEGVHSYFGRQFPIWEGHTRKSLETFLEVLCLETPTEEKVIAFITFLQSVTTGFTAGPYGTRLIAEVQNPTVNPRGNIPPQLKDMALKIIDKPNHIGFGEAAQHLRTLVRDRAEGFDGIKIDYPAELSDLIKLRLHPEALVGFAEISQRRSRSYPKPPRKALSTIHKSKGLEAENVVIFACDQTCFSNTQTKKNLLYVALSRATRNVTIVVSQNEPTPLLRQN